MENVILVIHLILALALIGVVLLQRSEGGGMGMGSGGGDGVMSARGAATALSKLTWIFAGAFLATSLALTVLSARDSAASDGVIELLGQEAPAATETEAAPATPVVPDVTNMMPPSATDTPATPPRADD